MAFRRIFFVLVLGFLVLSASADEGALAPREGVLVLRNGHVVQGRITRLGERYVVTFGESGEVRFPAGDVEFQCGSLDEAYFRKRDLLDPTSIRQRLDLADWCLRHDLPHRAADQMLAAAAINPFDARARALRRRLLQLAEAREMSHHSQAAPENEVDWQAIEQVLDTTPPEAVEEFTGGVQILLLNRCGTSACHGNPAISQFHLMRPLKDRVLPRRLTQRNLYAALQMIDYENPDLSPLLTVPRGPHGGQAGMFAGRQEEQWIPLRDWVRRATQTADAVRAGTAAGGEGVDRDDLSKNEGNEMNSVLPGDGGEIHRSVFSPAAAPAVEAQAPRDPFDPEIFNRRYFPEKSTPSMANTPVEATSRN
jgi:hypothetical protein